ncbi:MAG: 30S ribosomal protein S1 [Flavobacteriales bacterium]|nr:30S ribosomal protein S1 [Flavobacteriales bacterium]|tara:strand:- start:14679 stop:16670 length:1992 start_codon:yes stop_codon:yes gene_type:complete
MRYKLNKMTDKKKSADEGKEKKVVAKKTTTKKTAETKEKTETKAEKAIEEKAETPAKEPVKKAPPVAKKKEEIKPLADFDWDRIGKYEETYSAAEKKELEALYDETLKTIGNEEVIEGTIVAKTNRDVVVNIGFKSEGVISISEFRYNPDLKEGDKVEVFVVNQEDKNGQLILSHSRARALKAWDRVNEVLESQEIVKGYVKCRTKGGLIVDVFGIEAFLPGSQIDVKPVRDYDIYVDKIMEFKVVKINKEFKNIVVSHKALIEAELEQQKVQIISKLEKGQVLEGIVKNITSYGVFVDLGGVDGLIHITDLSWGRINHPEEILELDQKINVVILDFDDDKKRIALGVKQLHEHPWDKLDANLSVGDTVKGKVVVVADYGAFIEVIPGVEGLIHVSEITWSNHLKPAQEFFKVGQEVEAQVLTLDREERKMSLGVKQLTSDPWEDIETKYSVESKHKGKVSNISDFGVFVELESGVDGLIHISDLSWSKKINHPSEITKLGDEIEVVILEIDRENRRLSLGHKQLEENPWDVFETVFTEGSTHEGTVTEITPKGLYIVSLQYGVEGIVTKKNAEKEDGSFLAADEKASFIIVEFNKGAKKIVLSHTQTFKETEDDVKPKAKGKTKSSSNSAVKKVNDNIEKTTLGDLDALSNLKADLEKEEKK